MILTLKRIVKDTTCFKKLISITNVCIELGHWPTHFKVLTSIIISKPNKELYDSPKAFQPIILLNTTSKLIKKITGEMLQFQSIFNNFIHLYQLGGLKQCSTTSIGVVLTYFICICWVKNLTTSTLAFNIAQFFLSLNH